MDGMTRWRHSRETWQLVGGMFMALLVVFGSGVGIGYLFGSDVAFVIEPSPSPGPSTTAPTGGLPESGTREVAPLSGLTAVVANWTARIQAHQMNYTLIHGETELLVSANLRTSESTYAFTYSFNRTEGTEQHPMLDLPFTHGLFATTSAQDLGIYVELDQRGTDFAALIFVFPGQDSSSYDWAFLYYDRVGWLIWGLFFTDALLDTEYLGDYWGFVY